MSINWGKYKQKKYELDNVVLTKLKQICPDWIFISIVDKPIIIDCERQSCKQNRREHYNLGVATQSLTDDDLRILGDAIVEATKDYPIWKILPQHKSEFAMRYLVYLDFKAFYE